MLALATLLAETTIEINPFFGITGILTLAFGIYIAVDAGKYPDWAFERIGTKKSTWQIWPVVGGLCCGIVAIVMGVIWLASKKAEVEAAANGGAGGMTPPGAPPMAPPPPPPV
jgi:hypothetical protein